MRADLRLAWRQVRRTKGASALVVLLVALPVMGLSAGAAFQASRTPTPDESVTLRLGTAASMLVAVPMRGQGLTQAIDDPGAWSSVGSEAPRPDATPPAPPTSVSPLVPRDAHVIPTRSGAVRIATRAGIAWFPRTAGNVWDPALEGAFDVVSGSIPHSDTEAMATPSLLTRLGAAVGDTITLPDSGPSGAPVTLRVTGTLRIADVSRTGEDVLFTTLKALPDASTASLAPMSWYIADWQPRYADYSTLNAQGYGVYARDVVRHPPAGAYTVRSMSTGEQRWVSYAIGAVAAAASGFLVTLLAGAAFAVSARRQQRSLAVAASVGAARGDLFRIVVLQGLTLGLVGGIIGVVLGTAGVFAVLTVMDPGVQGLFWSHFALRLPWDMAIAIVVFAALIGTLSAFVPARAATRGDVLGALRGARRPAVLRKRMPVIGLGILAFGGAVGVVGGVIAAANSLRAATLTTPDAQIDTLRIVSLWMMIGGPILLLIGVIFSGHAVLRAVSRVLSPLGLAPRLAARDAAANPTRTVPAFTAITASVFIATFVLSSMALTAGASARGYFWSAPIGSVTATFVASAVHEDAAAYDEGAKAARHLLEGTDPTSMHTLSFPQPAPMDPDTRALVDDPTLLNYRPAVPGQCDGCYLGGLTIADPEAANIVFGKRLSAEDQQALRDGAILISGKDITNSNPTAKRPDTLRIDGFRAAAMGGGAGSDAPKPEVSFELPVVISAGPPSRYGAIITPETAIAHGIRFAPTALVATYDTPPGADVMDKLRADAQTASGPQLSIDVEQEAGPAPMAPWLGLVAGVAGLIVLGAAAISLGLSRFERRADDATLSAVGGNQVLRRGVNAWQAVIIAGLGSVIGVLGGLLPSWSMAQSSPGYFQAGDLPVLWHALLALGLPVLVAVCAWLVRPRTPDLTHRTAIA